MTDDDDLCYRRKPQTRLKARSTRQLSLKHCKNDSGRSIRHEAEEVMTEDDLPHDNSDAQTQGIFAIPILHALCATVLGPLAHPFELLDLNCTVFLVLSRHSNKTKLYQVPVAILRKVTPGLDTRTSSKFFNFGSEEGGAHDA